jgi:hypothetical protein
MVREGINPSPYFLPFLIVAVLSFVLVIVFLAVVVNVRHCEPFRVWQSMEQSIRLPLLPFVVVFFAFAFPAVIP